jgi:hypothetical protein
VQNNANPGSGVAAPQERRVGNLSRLVQEHTGQGVRDLFLQIQLAKCECRRGRSFSPYRCSVVPALYKWSRYASRRLVLTIDRTLEDNLLSA